MQALLNKLTLPLLPSSRTLALTALVTPYFLPPSRDKPYPPTPSITETITFDISASLISAAIRCSCLSRGNVCTAAPLEAHYLVEWSGDSILATKLDEDGKEVRKGGQLAWYRGPCRNGIKRMISEREVLCCVERAFRISGIERVRGDLVGEHGGRTIL